MIRRWRHRILRYFRVLERPAAWGLLIAGVVTFFSVVFGLIVVGEAKLATLLVAADLIVGGFSAVQESEDSDERGDQDDQQHDHQDPGDGR